MMLKEASTEHFPLRQKFSLWEDSFQLCPKNPARAQVALLLSHCRSLQLFLDTALRWEELGGLRASVVLLLVASSVAGCWKQSLNPKWLAGSRAACEELPVPRSDSFFWGLAGDAAPGGQYCWHDKYQTAIQSWTADKNGGWECSTLQNPCA